jgi:hypothetical protein
LSLTKDDLREISLDGGDTAIDLGEPADRKIAETNFDVTSPGQLKLIDPGSTIRIFGVWVPVEELSLDFKVNSERYLKYLTPDEYSELQDHLTGQTLPLHASFNDLPVDFDDPGEPIDETDAPVFTGLHFHITNVPGPFAGALSIAAVKAFDRVPRPS